MQQQSECFGADVVTSLDLTGLTKRVTLGDGTVREAAAVIYAAGSAYRKLGLPVGHRLRTCTSHPRGGDVISPGRGVSATTRSAPHLHHRR